MLTDTLGLRSGLPPWFHGTFADDDGNTHEAAIEAIAAAGITSGCAGGPAPRYCPSETVTRGQMVVFLQRALGLTASGVDHFEDDDDAWFEDAANAAADAGITMGCSSGVFCGNDGITRAQMASFLARALDYPPSTVDHFDDDDGSAHEAAINSIADAGVTQGCGGGRYCPDELVTRDQMASFLARALSL